MMQSSSPVDSEIALLLSYIDCAFETSSCIPLTVVFHVVENGAIFLGKVKPVDLVLVLFLNLRISGEVLEAVNVVITVEACEIDICDVLFVYFHDFHVLLHVVHIYELVCHLNSEWFHYMLHANLLNREFIIIIVRDFEFL